MAILPRGTLHTGNTQLDPDSDPITPPPPPTRRKSVHRATTVSDSDSSNTEKPAPKKRAKKKHTKEVEAVLVLLIPRAELEGSQRQVLSHATTYDEALDVIYATIGCARVAQKPSLMYKLSTATAKTEAISLSLVDDWAGCLEDVTDVEKKKAVSVKIIVTDQYLLSLRAKLGVKATGPKPKGKRIPVLDLDHTQDGEDDFDNDLGIMDKEKQWSSFKRHTAAASCAGQRRTHNVTPKTPLNDTLFSMFFEKSRRTASNSASTPFALPPFMGANAMNPYRFMPWGYPGMVSPFAAALTTRATPMPAPASVTAGFCDGNNTPVADTIMHAWSPKST
ncbi:hypothetical protein C8R43DRAFT_965525 [Mycena crocata]|nr:hypothetical protein C8R43DRAFT_965525 [Mycena crocata]